MQTRFPQEGSIVATGHAHIDLAWLWPMVETRRKAVRTFHTALQLMDQFPEFQFNHSTAQLYDFIGQDDPELLTAITDKVKAGQWEPIGAMWVEPDTNMPSGESLIRQLLYGIRYFDRQFGKRSTVLWLPDVFGFSPVLPQLLRSVGMTSVFTIKTNWSEKNKLPHDLFHWQGLDGSEVIMHTFENPADGYNAEMGPRATLGTWGNYQDKELLPGKPALLWSWRRRWWPDRGLRAAPAPDAGLPGGAEDRTCQRVGLVRGGPQPHDGPHAEMGG